MPAWDHLERKIESLYSAVVNLTQRVHLMSASLDNLTAESAKDRATMIAATAIISSVSAQFAGLQAQLAQAIQAAKDGDDHAALDQLAADMSASRSALDAQVAAFNAAGAPADPSATPSS